MNFSFKKYKQTACIVLLFFFTLGGMAQLETSKWKFQIATGISFPESTGFINPYVPKAVNFPSINLGLQHMLNRQFGAKLDFAYYRFSNANNTPEFRTNYTRFNAQLVYDGTKDIPFLPDRFAVIGHVGPGITFTKPLGDFTANKETFANVLAGFETHYSINKTVTIFTDISYIFSLAGNKTYNPISDGFGAFTGNIFTVTFGVSVSLSGCYYCD